MHYTMVALKLQSSNITGREFFFGAFGAWYFLCVFCQSDGPPHWERGIARGITRGGGGNPLPHTHCANTEQVLVQGAKVRKHGVAVLG